MRKFVSAAATAMILAAGVSVPTASADILSDISNAINNGIFQAKCAGFKEVAEQRGLLHSGADTTRGEFERSMLNKGNDDFMPLGVAAFGDKFDANRTKKENANLLGAAAAKCGFVKEGFVPEVTALSSNLLDTLQNKKGDDNEAWGSSDVFSAFSSGLSS